MKATIERAKLLRCLSHVQSVVERRNTIPILSNVLIEASADGRVRIMATDLDHLQVEVGRHDPDQPVGRGLDQHVREDRDRVAPLDHRLHVRQAAKQLGAFDCGLHRSSSNPNCAPPV